MSTTTDDWVQYDERTHEYVTGDGTRVCAFLCDNVHCLADVLHIANIRAKQRADMQAAAIAKSQESTK